MMKIEHEKIIDYVLGHLEASEVKDIEHAMLQDVELLQKIEELKSSLSLWEKIDYIELPNTSKQMDDKFYHMLEQEKQSTQKNKASLLDKLINLLQQKQIKSFVYACSFLMIGIYIGHLYTFKQNSLNNSHLITSSNQTAANDHMYEMAVTSMLQLPSVNMRLQAVNLVDKGQHVQESVVSALLHTLNHDNNINVRLSVLSVLAKYSNTASVRKGLVDAILLQDSPIIQMEIAKLMVSLQETKAVEPLKELLNTKPLIAPVKETINNTLNALI